MLKNINEIHLYVTGNCNMKCIYCSDVSKRIKKYHENFMDINIALEYIDLIIRSTCAEHIQIVFHGGEPSLVPASWYSSIIDYISVETIKWKKTYELSLQSNCLAINDDLFDLIKLHNITVGGSLDGPPKINNLSRMNGAKALKNIKRLQEINRLGGVITVITKTNYHKVPEMMKFYEAQRLYDVSLNFVYLAGEAKVLTPLSSDDIFYVLLESYRYFVQTQGKKVVERMMKTILSKYITKPTKADVLNSLDCYSPFCHAGIKTIICGVDGDLYPCGCSDYNKFHLGTLKSINEDNFNNILKNLHKKNEKYTKVCSRCNANTICTFGCPAFSDQDKITDENICLATKRFYTFLCNEDQVLIRGYLSNVKNTTSTLN